jgi:hypothetical protein
MPAKKKSARKRLKSKKTLKKSKKTLKKKTAARKAKRVSSKAARKGKPSLPRVIARTPKPASGEQSGDLQGLSRHEGADSESVQELLEEGNPFEAGVVSGVEEADLADEEEVRTHEVPEDDVPDEYLDKDS